MDLDRLKELVVQFRWPLVILLLGLVSIGGGLLAYFSSTSSDKIEILSSEGPRVSEPKQLSVDIEGAVEKPGVYHLDVGSRVDDLLIMAGGFSSSADREWVEKTLNRAQKLEDGAKIYIPKKGGTPSASSGQASIINSTDSVDGGVTERLVNVNTASRSELEALWGIGEATAKNIIANRPYQRVEELLTKKILKSNVYQKISEQLTVY